MLHVIILLSASWNLCSMKRLALKYLALPILKLNAKRIDFFFMFYKSIIFPKLTKALKNSAVGLKNYYLAN